MPQWFYLDGDRTVGPFKPTELLELVRHSTVNAETMVRKDQSGWFPAGQVGGLFESAARPSVEFHCPECGMEVAKPPCYCRRCRRALSYARPRVIENVIEGYEKPERNGDSISDSWKQWVRRLTNQRDERVGRRRGDDSE